MGSGGEAVLMWCLEASRARTSVPPGRVKESGREKWNVEPHGANYRRGSTRYAIVENSPMLVGRGLAVVLGDLAALGYDAKWGVLGAHHVAAPHKRDRIWIVANSSCISGDKWWPECPRQQREARSAKDFGEMANAKGQRCVEKGCDRSHEPEEWLAGSGATMADTESKGLEGLGADSGKPQEPEPRNGISLGHSESIGRQHEEQTADNPTGQGLPIAAGGPSGAERGAWWATDPELGRVAHGVANRVDRLRCLGNGQVPAVVPIAWNFLR